MKLFIFLIFVHTGLFAAEGSCLLLAKGYDKSNIKNDLQAFLDAFYKDLENKDFRKIHKLIMPRLEVSEFKMRQIFTTMDASYGEGWKLVPHRVWRLSSKRAERLACPEERVHISAHYGFDETLALWLQISGPRNLGRLYVSLVQQEGAYKIGSFHAQQWTYLDKDYTAWLKEAHQSFNNKDELLGAVQLSLAKKLAYGGGHLEIDDEAEITKLFRGESWIKDLVSRDWLETESLIHADSILHDKGLGILVRMLTDEETKSDKLAERCRVVADFLFQKLDQAFEVVKCGFNTKTENPLREGYHGARHMFRSDLNKSSTQKAKQDK